MLKELMNKMDWRTKLLNPSPKVRQDYRSLATPVFRDSTVLFDDQAVVTDDWRQELRSFKGHLNIHCAWGTGDYSADLFFLLPSRQSCFGAAVRLWAE